jgi:hypothetical protein
LYGTIPLNSPRAAEQAGHALSTRANLLEPTSTQQLLEVEADTALEFALGHHSRESDLRLIGLPQPPGIVSQIKLRV